MLFADSALAQVSNAGEQQPPVIAYDITAQDLATALSSYAAATGIQVLYETALTAGRQSGQVKGTLTPEVALQTLLNGTGLIGRRTDVDAITIIPEPRTSAARAPAIMPDARFLGLLQASIRAAMCHEGEAPPGNYRMALQIWIAPAGQIQRASLLSSTGDARRDSLLIERLQGMTTGMMPPVGMSQPITFVIVPRSDQRHSDCAM